MPSRGRGLRQRLGLVPPGEPASSSTGRHLTEAYREGRLSAGEVAATAAAHLEDNPSAPADVVRLAGAHSRKRLLTPGRPARPDTRNVSRGVLRALAQAASLPEPYQFSVPLWGVSRGVLRALARSASLPEPYQFSVPLWGRHANCKVEEIPPRYASPPYWENRIPHANQLRWLNGQSARAKSSARAVWGAGRYRHTQMGHSSPVGSSCPVR